jgi:hypothetical protein
MQANDYFVVVITDYLTCPGRTGEGEQNTDAGENHRRVSLPRQAKKLIFPLTT